MHAFKVTGRAPPRYFAEQVPCSPHLAAAHKLDVSVNPGLSLQVADPQSQYVVASLHLVLQSSGHSAARKIPSLIELQSIWGKSKGWPIAHAPVFPHA